MNPPSVARLQRAVADIYAQTVDPWMQAHLDWIMPDSSWDWDPDHSNHVRIFMENDTSLTGSVAPRILQNPVDLCKSEALFLVALMRDARLEFESRTTCSGPVLSLDQFEQIRMNQTPGEAGQRSPIRTKAQHLVLAAFQVYVKHRVQSTSIYDVFTRLLGNLYDAGLSPSEEQVVGLKRILYQPDGLILNSFPVKIDYLLVLLRVLGWILRFPNPNGDIQEDLRRFQQDYYHHLTQHKPLEYVHVTGMFTYPMTGKYQRSLQRTQ